MRTSSADNLITDYDSSETKDCIEISIKGKKINRHRLSMILFYHR